MWQISSRKHWEDRSTISSRKPWAYGRRHWSRNLYSCTWISYVNGMAVPYQATDCTLSLPTAANWRRVLMRHRRFHFMNVWHNVWHNVCIVCFLASRSVARGGSVTIWSGGKSPILISPNWLTVVDSSTSLHSPPLGFAIVSFHGLPWCSRLSCI